MTGNSKLRPLLAVMVLLLAGLLAWNVSLQRDLKKYRPQEIGRAHV